MKSTRSKGKALEVYIADRLREVLNDPSIQPSKNSGASTQLADILCSRFLVECKKRETKNITIIEEVWKKLVSEIPLGSIRIPLYILENKNKKRWVCLDFEDFCEILCQD